MEAKVCWLINICSLTPDVEKGNFNAWGTDKQLTFYHIRDIFRRSYHFSCSSDNCPSKDTDISACIDVVNDMILHAPSNTDYLSLATSIQEWEQGSSHNALESCKERFQQQPNHSDFISEVDRGEEVTWCSGWRNAAGMKFVNTPPFLIFDISSSYRENIKSLDLIPVEASIYGDNYRLGGATSFVPSTAHYVGYIFLNNEFLFHDGLPPEKTVLRKYRSKLIDGDVSLLIYFPLDGFDSSHDKLNNNKSPSSSTTKRNINVDIKGEQEISDHLLAAAIFDLENENAYKKPVGKSYRRIKRDDPVVIQTPNTHIKIKQCPPCLNNSSPPSSLSSSNDDEIDVKPLIDFIDEKRDFIMALISDSSYSSEFHLRSERIMALKYCKSLSVFEACGKEEYEIISTRMKAYIGSSFLPPP